MTIVALILTILGLIVTIIVEIVAKASFLTILLSIVPFVIIIFLLFELRSDTKRIQRLEEALLEKEIIAADDIYDIEVADKMTDTQNEDMELPEGVKLCPKCNYQVFPEDKVCPNCQTPLKGVSSTKGQTKR